MKKEIVFWVITLTLITINYLTGHGVATHINVGRATYSVWYEYDRAFYDSLTKTTSTYPEQVSKMKLLKFYYIGLTLPDMFLEDGQKFARGIIDTLYDMRNSLCDPLRITDATHNNVQTPIIFIDPQPNQNLKKLQLMTEYARNQCWTPYEKSLIYGAYMHVIQDIYGHMVLQPAQFGYGFALDSDSAQSEPILHFGETWHEIFTPTHISDWYTPINILFYGIENPTSNNPQLRRAPMQFYREHNSDGSNYHGWQDLDFVPVQKFIQAATAVNYQIANFTQERFESYLHGWAMILFLTCGYRSNCSDVGGIFAHPNWTHVDIRSFWADIGDDFPNHWTIGIPFLDNYARHKVYNAIYNGFSFLDSFPPNRTWPEYFEYNVYFRDIWECIPLTKRTPENQREFERYYSNLTYWNIYAVNKPPNLRYSYDQEVSDAINISNLYITSLDSGEHYIDYHINNYDIWTISRKAGLLGGMFNPTSEVYYKQPGVLNAGFKKDGNPIWTNITVGLQGDSVNVNLFYDLIPFGSTRLKVIGKTTAGNEIELLPLEYSSNTPNRWSGENSLHLQQAVNQNSNLTEIFFRIATKNKNSSDYTEMLNSDYHQAFNSSSAISSNELYRQWFNYGEPIREPHQNPFQSPLQFWPYACSLKVVPVYLNQPTNLIINDATSSITINWNDNSNFELGYSIEKSINQGDFIEIGNVGQNINQFIDADVNGISIYNYRVRAYRTAGAETFYSDYSNIVTSPYFASTPYITGFNNTNRIAFDGRNIHLAFRADSTINNNYYTSSIYYTYSTDYGNTWQLPILVASAPNNQLRFLTAPALALDAQKRPHIIYGINNGGQTINYKHCVYTNGQWITDFLGGTIGYPGNSPEPIIHPSFIIAKDSGFFIVNTFTEEDGGIYCGRFGFNSEGIPQNVQLELVANTNIELYGNPSITYDKIKNRIIIAYVKNTGTRNIYLTYKASSTWLHTLISSININNNCPSLSCDTKGNICIAWLGNETNYKGNVLTRIAYPNSNNSYSLSSICQLSNSGWISYAPISISGNIVNWSQQSGVNSPLEIFYSIFFNSQWSIPTQLSTTNNMGSNYPQSCVTGNPTWMKQRLFTIWTEGNYAPYFMMPASVNLPWSPYVTCDMATGPNNGVHLDRIPNSKELYTVFQEQNNIYSPRSNDEGENWTTDEVDNGLYPCVGLNYRGLPWIAYCKDGDLVCKMKRDDDSWKEILIYDGDNEHWAGPPSMQLATLPIEEDVIDYAYITYPVYLGTMPDGPGEQPPTSEHSYIYVSLFDTTGNDIVTHLIDEGDDQTLVSHPCVAVTPADLVHICWQKDEEIWYITNADKVVTPENWKEVKWTSAFNISSSQEVSKHPFIETYGDEVWAIWSEGEPSEIIRRPRIVSYEYDEWGEPENISNSAEVNSDYPQMSTRDICVWQEEGAGHNYKVYGNIFGEIVCLTPDANNASYVHTNVLVEDPQAPELTVYYCYTDEIIENELYEVKFDKFNYPDGMTVPPPPEETADMKYYEADLGNELASAYCEQRTGYKDYGNYKIDYGNNHLKYKLKYLNPCKKYLFQGILYQCTTATIRQKLEVEETLASDNTISYAIPETISFFIRPNSYKKDMEAKLKINKLHGAYSVLSKFKLYEYETIDSTGGSGPQSSGTERLPIPTRLYSPKPNPFNNRTEIRFQIPIRTNVDLKVYNSTGRLVKTIIDENMRPGIYNLIWDGKDNQNRIQSKGIYFVRLKTNDYSETKKIVMVK